jgi:hypothetical protein
MTLPMPLDGKKNISDDSKGAAPPSLTIGHLTVKKGSAQNSLDYSR